MNLKAKIERFKNYSLKGLKVMDTMDGYAYTATVLEDGRVIGRVEQGGYGGPTMVDIVPEARERLNAYVSSLPEISSHGMTFKVDNEIFFDELQAHTSVMTKLKRAAKTKTLFSLTTHAADEYCALNREFSPAVKAALEARHGASLQCIFNELV